MDKRASIIDKRITSIRSGAARAMSGRGMVPNESDERTRWEFHRQNPVAMNDYVLQVARSRGIMDAYGTNEIAANYIRDMSGRFG